MSHSLMRLKGSLTNTPHLIEPNSFNNILEYVNKRIEGNVEITKKELSTWDDVDGDFSSRYYDDSQTGFMSIEGPLTYKTSGWEALCGGTSYEMLKGQMEYFVSQGAKTVVMVVDSGGGMAHGMIDSANYIRKLADENDIKILCMVDGMSASAAYGISCIADEIVMTSDSLTGSVGVLIQLINQSKMLEKAGIERTFITAGKDKIPFNEDGSFTKEFIDGLQDQVDTLYEAFTSHVAVHRNLDVSVVKGTEANVFMSEESLKIGFADKIMTAEEFYEYAADFAHNNIEGKDMNFKDAFKMTSTKENAEMAKLEELQTQLEAQQTAHATKLLEASELITSLTAQLEGFKEAQALAEQAAATKKLESRKASLSEVMPAEQVETRLSAYAALDDNTFAFMVSELQTAKDARAESFKPVGEEGAEAEQTQLSATDAILKAGVEAAKARR